MKKLIAVGIAVLGAVMAFAQSTTLPGRFTPGSSASPYEGDIYLRFNLTTGQIVWPTNFWTGNSNQLNATVSVLATNLANSTNATITVLADRQMVAYGTNTVIDGSVNLERLRRFYDGVDADTNCIKLLIVGDSLANQFPDSCGVSYGVVQTLIDQYGVAGTAPRMGRYTYNPRTADTRYYNVSFKNGSSSPNGATAYAGDGGYTLSDTEMYGVHFYTTNGTYLDWYNYNNDEAPQGNLIGFAWVARPNGTNFNVTVSSNAGSSYVTLGTCDGYAATPQLRYTNWNVLTANYRVRATNGFFSGATNNWLGSSVINTNHHGIVPWVLDRGGAGFSDLTNSIVPMHGVLTNWNPDLILVNMVDFGEGTPNIYESQLTNAIRQWFGLRTNTPVLVLGSQPNGNSEAYAAGDNVIMRKTALLNRWSFFDPSYYCQNLTRGKGDGYFADAVHLTGKGAVYLAQPLMERIGMLQMPRLRQVLSNAVAHIRPSNFLTNLVSITVNDVDLTVGGSADYNITDSVRYNGPNITGAITVGTVTFWDARKSFWCSDLGSSYKIWANVGNSRTLGKTNVSIVQRFWTTNSCYWTTSCAVDYNGTDGAIRAQAGGYYATTNAITTNPYVVQVTNSFSLPSACTNGQWSFWFGRGYTTDTGGEGVNGFAADKGVGWLGAELYFW